MKFTSFLVLFLLTFNVFAAALTPAQELERALDSYQYSLSVEWDQKDQKFYENATNGFFNQLAALKAKGLTSEQIEALVEGKVSNKEALAALKLKLSTLSGASSAQEVARALSANAKDFYSRGASWNGDVVVYVGVGVLVAALIGYEVWFNATHTCVAYADEWVCNNYNSCSGGYYDPYYGGYSGCYGSSYSTCGWQSVCTQWEKKK